MWRPEYARGCVAREGSVSTQWQLGGSEAAEGDVLSIATPPDEWNGGVGHGRPGGMLGTMPVRESPPAAATDTNPRTDAGSTLHERERNAAGGAADGECVDPRER